MAFLCSRRISLFFALFSLFLLGSACSFSSQRFVKKDTVLRDDLFFTDSSTNQLTGHAVSSLAPASVYSSLDHDQVWHGYIVIDYDQTETLLDQTYLTSRHVVWSGRIDQKRASDFEGYVFYLTELEGKAREWSTQESQLLYDVSAELPLYVFGYSEALAQPVGKLWVSSEDREEFGDYSIVLAPGTDLSFIGEDIRTGKEINFLYSPSYTIGGSSLSHCEMVHDETVLNYPDDCPYFITANGTIEGVFSDSVQTDVSTLEYVVRWKFLPASCTVFSPVCMRNSLSIPSSLEYEDNTPLS